MDVYVVDVASGRPRASTTDEAEDRYPTYSRDGRSIYFSSNRSGRFEIYKMPVEAERLFKSRTAAQRSLSKSHDAHRSYYEYLEGNLGHTGDTPIWRVLVDGSAPPIEVLPEGGSGARSIGYWRVTASTTCAPGADSSIRYRDLGSGADIEIPFRDAHGLSRCVAGRGDRFLFHGAARAIGSRGSWRISARTF